MASTHVLRGRVHEHRLLRGDHHLQRASRALRPAEPDPQHVRVGPRSGWRIALLDANGNWWLDYAAWQGGSPGCTSYGCGAARQLFVAPISLPSAPAPIVGMATSVDGGGTGWWPATGASSVTGMQCSTARPARRAQ